MLEDPLLRLMFEPLPLRQGVKDRLADIVGDQDTETIKTPHHSHSSMNATPCGARLGIRIYHVLVQTGQGS